MECHFLMFGIVFKGRGKGTWWSPNGGSGEAPTLTFLLVFFSSWRNIGGLRFSMFYGSFRPAFFSIFNFIPSSSFTSILLFKKEDQSGENASVQYQISTAPVVSAVVPDVAFAAVVSDADDAAPAVDSAVTDALVVAFAEAAAPVVVVAGPPGAIAPAVAASADVTVAARPVGHPAGEEGLQPLTTSSQPPNHRGPQKPC